MTAIERLKRVNARAEPEESVAFRIAVLVAVMAAAGAVLAQGVGGPGLKLAVAVIPGAFWYSHRARHGDGFWLKVGLAGAVIVAFTSFLGSLGTARAGSLATVQIPLAELFLWVQLLHAFDVPARRDLLFSLVSSLVLMAVAGVLSISMDLLWFLGVWAVAAAAAMVLSYRSELSALPGLPRSLPSVASGGGLARGRPRGARAPAARSVGATVLVVVLVGAAAFFVLPPAGQARALTFPSQLARVLPVPEQGGLSNPSLGGADPGRGGSDPGGRGASFGYFGFSDSLDTGLRGRPDDTLVMRVRASKPDFWRGQSFDVWDGRTWRLSSERSRVLGGGGSIEVPPPPGEDRLDSGSELVQTYYLRRAGPNVVFGANRVTRLYFPDRRVFQLSDGTLRAGVALDEDAAYTVVSRRPPATGPRLRAADLDVSRGVPEPIAARYLALPEVPARVRELATRVTASAPSVYDKVRALEAWMGAHTRYSLDIPPLPGGADAVEQFLFVDRTGFCEQIATSLVVMLRSLGVPARLAVGYAAGQRNPFTGLYEVRASDAHAWTEVWFPGIGWQAFDPTARVPLAGDAELSRASSGIASYLADRLPHPPAWAIGLVVALGLAAVAVAGMVRLRAVLARRRSGRPRTWAEACLARLERTGAGRGRPRRSSETFREYAASLRRGGLGDHRLEEAAAIVMRDAFSGAPASADERALVEKVLADVEV